jgi:hypothetical protein
VQSEVPVGLTSAGVGALAIAAGAVTTVLSLKVQRESTSSTLETQRFLAVAQEAALRDRSHAEELRQQRAPLYGYLLRWSESLASGLSQLNAELSELPKSLWHIEPAMEDAVDLYASDAIHFRFNALRGLLIGIVEGSGFSESRVVTWTEQGEDISDVSITITPPLIGWADRERIRDQAYEGTLELAAKIRAEVQGRRHSGFFVTYRLSR